MVPSTILCQLGAATTRRVIIIGFKLMIYLGDRVKNTMLYLMGWGARSYLRLSSKYRIINWNYLRCGRVEKLSHFEISTMNYFPTATTIK